MVTSDDDASAQSLAQRVPGRRVPWVLAFVAGLAASVTTYGLWNRSTPSPARLPVQTGKATITSRPDGLAVTIDDQARGHTPLTLTLPAGSHQLRIEAGATVRTVPLIIEPNKSALQYVDLAAVAVPSGELAVTSEPSGLSVTLDGVAAGKTPLSLASVAAGERRLVIGDGKQAVTRTVTIEAGRTAAVAVSIGSGATATGAVAFKAPIEMQVMENGRRIGVTGRGRVRLSSGSHRIDLVNEQVEFRTTLTIQVADGATTTRVIDIPNGSLSVNAAPWADVEIDGRAAGTTPLGNLALPVGSHEVVWTHPQLGERRQTVVVKAKTPTRIGMNFGQP